MLCDRNGDVGQRDDTWPVAGQGMARHSHRPRRGSVFAEGMVALAEALSAVDASDAWYSELLRSDDGLELIAYMLARAIVTAPARKQSNFLLTLSNIGPGYRTHIKWHCANNHLDVLAIGIAPLTLFANGFA